MLNEYTGNDPDLFTVEIEHNGFFCGLRDNLTYISGTIDYFDDCHSETFSMFWMEEFMHVLDYQFNGRLHLYWLKPGEDIMDGLQCLENDKEFLDMVSAAAVERKMCVLIDHMNFLLNLRPDMVRRPDDGTRQGGADDGNGQGDPDDGNG
jgi:hypothetical protein